MNVLLSTYDFNNNRCYEQLKHLLKPNMKVVICPFSHDVRYYVEEELFNSLYDYRYGKDYNILCDAFYDYGIEKQNIYPLNPYKDTLDYMKHRIESADILFFTGGDPIFTMYYIKELGLFEVLKNFKGITMGASAGAMVQLEEFMTYYLPWEEYPYEYFEGLGYVKDLDVIVHWENNEWQDIAKIISHTERRIPYLNLKDGDLLIFNKN